MELREALDRVAEIRRRMAEAETFRGYRALPAACAGLLAVAAGLLQSSFVPDPAGAALDYVLFWGTVAALSLGVCVGVMWLRDRAARAHGGAPVTHSGIAPLVPCLVAGACVTVVLVRLAPGAAWLLPGLWQLFFSQGLFASCRTLPRPLFAVPSFYLAAGLATLCLARGPHALSPLAMALPFGAGQLLAAALLYWTLERHDRTEETDAEP
jgi:hypothetical protein